MGNRLLKFRLSAALALSFVSVFLCACSGNSIEPRIAARVGHEKIFVTDLAVRLLQIPNLQASLPNTQNEVAKLVLESIIDERVLALEAQKHGVTVPKASIEHEIRQQEAMLGRASFSHYMTKNFLNKQKLSAQLKQQLEGIEYLRRVQLAEKPFCDAVFGVQSSQNCTKKGEFLARMRKKYPIVVNQDLIPLALLAISGAE